jgi:hypothetical protein
MIKIKINGDASGLNRAIKNVKPPSAGGVVGGALMSVAGGALGMGIAGATAAVAATAALARNTINTAKEIGDSAARMGTSTKEAQDLIRMAQVSGINQAGLENSFKKLKEFVGKVSNDSKEAGEALKKMGLTADDIKGKSIYEVFDRISPILQSITNETEKAKIANQIFGETAFEIDPLIRTYRDLKKETLDENPIFDEAFIKASQAFLDELGELEKNIKNIIANSGILGFLAESAVLAMIYMKYREKFAGLEKKIFYGIAGGALAWKLKPIKMLGGAVKSLKAMRKADKGLKTIQKYEKFTKPVERTFISNKPGGSFKFEKVIPSVYESAEAALDVKGLKGLKKARALGKIYRKLKESRNIALASEKNLFSKAFRENFKHTINASVKTTIGLAGINFALTGAESVLEIYEKLIEEKEKLNITDISDVELLELAEEIASQKVDQESYEADLLKYLDEEKKKEEALVDALQDIADQKELQELRNQINKKDEDIVEGLKDKNSALEKEIFILEQIQKSRKQFKDLTEDEEKQIRELSAKLFDMKKKEDRVYKEEGKPEIHKEQYTNLERIGAMLSSGVYTLSPEILVNKDILKAHKDYLAKFTIYERLLHSSGTLGAV